jgi:hypothetical protein
MLLDFLNSPAGYALQAALVAAFLDFAFGVFAALRDGTFALDSVAAFVRKHLLGRVFPIGTLALMGYLTADVRMNAAAAAALTLYAAETMASIYGSIAVKDTNPETAIPTD